MQNCDHRKLISVTPVSVLSLICNLLLQIYGPESSGKTTLALHAIAEVQVIFFCELLRSDDFDLYIILVCC